MYLLESRYEIDQF